MKATTRRLGLGVLAVALAGCPTGRVPTHLAPPDTGGPGSEQAKIETIDSLLAAMIGRDPLGRNATNVEPGVAEAIEGGAPYAELLRVASKLEPGGEDALRQIRDLEASNRGTPIVALSRGLRVREIEAVVGARTALDDASEVQVASLLTPLSSASNAANQPARALRWLTPLAEVRDPVLTVADRWALLGWLDGPGMELQPVADALATPPYDALRRTSAAKLVLARAAGASADPEPGLADLERASVLLLVEAVASRKREKEAVAERWKALADELQADAPRDALLSRAEGALVDSAGTDLGAGGALLALQARRIWGDCPTEPCIGVDRVDGLTAAGRWDPRLERISRRLRLAALHDAIDGIEVAQGTVRYPQAAVELADALIGTGAVPPDGLVLRQRTPDASTWLALGRTVGVEQVTTWEEARHALRTWAAERATEALADETDDEAEAAFRTIQRAASSTAP